MGGGSFDESRGEEGGKERGKVSSTGFLSSVPSPRGLPLSIEILKLLVASRPTHGLG